MPQSKADIARYQKLYKIRNKKKIKLYKQNWAKKNKKLIAKKRRIKYLKNRKLILKKQKQYYKENQPIIRQQRKQSYIKNREKILLQCKKYRIAHKKEYSKYFKKYKKLHADKIREHNRKRRAKKKLVKENFTATQEKIVYKYFNNKCFNCGSIKKLTIDHHKCLDDGNPLTFLNAVVLCRSCNSSKWKHSPEKFYGIEKLKYLETLLISLDDKYKGQDNINSLYIECLMF